MLYVQSLQRGPDPAKTESGAVLCEPSWSATFILYIISHTWLHTPNCRSPTEHRLPGMIIFSYKVAAMTISLWNTACLTAAPGSEISGCGGTFPDLPILWGPCNYLWDSYWACEPLLCPQRSSVKACIVKIERDIASFPSLLFTSRFPFVRHLARAWCCGKIYMYIYILFQYPHLAWFAVLFS